MVATSHGKNSLTFHLPLHHFFPDKGKTTLYTKPAITSLWPLAMTHFGCMCDITFIHHPRLHFSQPTFKSCSKAMEALAF